MRYGARGVHVHGYRRADLDKLAATCGLDVAKVDLLGRAGFLVMFARPTPRDDGQQVARGAKPTAHA